METKEIKRFRYEAPVVMDLGEMAMGSGSACNASGTQQNTVSCDSSGIGATTTCSTTGNYVAAPYACTDGSSPVNTGCYSGTAAFSCAAPGAAA